MPFSQCLLLRPKHFLLERGPYIKVSMQILYLFAEIPSVPHQMEFIHLLFRKMSNSLVRSLKCNVNNKVAIYVDVMKITKEKENFKCPSLSFSFVSNSVTKYQRVKSFRNDVKVPAFKCISSYRWGCHCDQQLTTAQFFWNSHQRTFTKSWIFIFLWSYWHWNTRR